MLKLVSATRNTGKLAEMVAMLGDDVELVSPGTAVEVVEDGATFLENAVKKAHAMMAASGLPAIADDSGLEVDELGGAPGVMSARYAGDGASDAAKAARLLAELAGVDTRKRKAHFTCVVAVVFPGGRVIWAEGRCEGLIARAPRGENGFGYDPVFVVPELGGRTFAEVDAATKNRVSHRARALEALKRRLGDEGLLA